MSEEQVETMLLNMLERRIDAYAQEHNGQYGHAGARSFNSAMIMTMNKGVVLTTPKGHEFQITIVRSR